MLERKVKAQWHRTPIMKNGIGTSGYNDNSAQSSTERG
jgi:hypothetical protein